MTEISNTQKKLNIVVFGHKRIPSREGGIEIVVEELTVRMAAQGYTITCYNRTGHHVSGKEFDHQVRNEYKGVHIKTVPTIEGKGLAAVTSSLFGAIYSAVGKYDVVHIHAEGPAVFAWIPKLFRKKVIVTIHGLDWQRAKWQGSFGKRYIKYGEKCAVKRADEIIVLSKGMQEYFQKEYGRKTVFIPNGVNEPKVVEVNQIRKKWDLEKDSYVLYLGRLVPEKGEHYLIKAWKNINSDKRLVIAGGGSDTEKYMAELRNAADGDERIIFTGFVEGDTLEELYSNAYVYVLPSDLEGMPLSLLEAMSYGNCCVVSDIPECVEVVEDKAVIFKRSNVNDLMVKLQKLIDEPETVWKYKKQAADFICEKYNWDKITRETMELYLK